MSLKNELNSPNIDFFEIYIQHYIPRFHESFPLRYYEFCSLNHCGECEIKKECGMIFEGFSPILEIPEIDYIKLKYPEYFI